MYWLLLDISTLGWVKLNQLTPSYNLGVPVASVVSRLKVTQRNCKVDMFLCDPRHFEYQTKVPKCLGHVEKYVNKKTGLITETK